MAISIRHKGDVQILDMEGDFAVGRSMGRPLDLKGHRPQDLGETISDLLNAGQNRIILNLAKVRFIDSAGLGELIASRKRTLQTGGDIKLLHPAGQVRDVLILTLLADVFEIHHDEEKAVAAFDGKP